MTSLPETISALRAANDELVEENRQLRQALLERSDFSRIARFSPQEATILAAMLRFDVVTFDQIFAALYSARYGKEAAGADIVKVHVCRIRKKLKRYEVSLESVYGRGYRIAPEHKARLRAEMEASNA